MFCYNQRPPRFSLVYTCIYIYVCMHVCIYIYMYHAFNPIFLLDLQLSKFLWQLGMVYCCGSHHPKYDLCILWLNHDHQSSPMIQHSLSPNGPSFWWKQIPGPTFARRAACGAKLRYFRRSWRISRSICPAASSWTVTELAAWSDSYCIIFYVWYVGLSENSVPLNPLDYHHCPQTNAIWGYTMVNPIFRHSHVDEYSKPKTMERSPATILLGIHCSIFGGVLFGTASTAWFLNRFEALKPKLPWSRSSFKASNRFRHNVLLCMEEILHQLIDGLSHYLYGFIHPRWCRISSIHSITVSWVLSLVSLSWIIIMYYMVLLPFMFLVVRCCKCCKYYFDYCPHFGHHYHCQYNGCCYCYFLCSCRHSGCRKK